MDVILDIGRYLYRLVPGNPILQRVVATGGKRRRDLLIRCVYLGSLVLMVVMMLLSSAGSLDRADLAQLTKRSGQIFMGMSYVQLALVALLAPVFTAGAITQEKDSQTYDILLATPLTNGQIVLGSLLSRLFFVLALLVSGIPIFSITQIFGGVAIRSIVQSFAIAAATAVVTGALAMAIAVFKVGTQRTIFGFYVLIVLFLATPPVIEWMGYWQVAGSGKDTHINWLSGVNPFLALQVIFNDGQYIPPDLGQAHIAHHPRWVQWYLSSPHTFYASAMSTLSLLLVAPSVVLLRRLAQSTTPLRWQLMGLLRLVRGTRARKARRVWVNPIAWREARTKASAARATFLRHLFVWAGVGGALVLVAMYARRIPADSLIASRGYDPVNRILSVVDKGELRILRLDTDKLNADNFKLHDQPATMEHLRPGMIIRQLSTSASGDNALVTRLWLGGPRSRLDPQAARRFVLAAVLVELAVIVLIITQSAASTVTREKEDGTLDLLLSTPITSRYYIWGKLRGLVSFAMPLLAVPMLTLVLFILHDAFRWLTDPPHSTSWMVFPEAMLVLPPMLLAVCALAAIVGMQVSLRCRKTVVAVMSSVGIMLALCVGLGACGHSALASRDLGQFGLIAGALSPFTLAWILIDPAGIATHVFGPGADVVGARVMVLLIGWVVAGIYAAIVWSMHKSMVRNFDMTIRRQAG